VIIRKKYMFLLQEIILLPNDIDSLLFYSIVIIESQLIVFYCICIPILARDYNRVKYNEL
jgi:hypothetical protein